MEKLEEAPKTVQKATQEVAKTVVRPVVRKAPPTPAQDSPHHLNDDAVVVVMSPQNFETLSDQFSLQSPELNRANSPASASDLSPRILSLQALVRNFSQSSQRNRYEIDHWGPPTTLY
jgi:hypothetical protein